MSQGELLLLTYDEAIKSLKRALIFLDGGNYDSFDKSIEKAVKIVRYLEQTLDLEQPISSDLERIYEYMLYDLSLVRAGRERRKEELPELIHILEDIREGFQRASLEARDTHIPSTNRVLV